MTGTSVPLRFSFASGTQDDRKSPVLLFFTRFWITGVVGTGPILTTSVSSNPKIHCRRFLQITIEPPPMTVAGSLSPAELSKLSYKIVVVYLSRILKIISHTSVGTQQLFRTV